MSTGNKRVGRDVNFKDVHVKSWSARFKWKKTTVSQLSRCNCCQSCSCRNPPRANVNHGASDVIAFSRMAHSSCHHPHHPRSNLNFFSVSFWIVSAITFRTFPFPFFTCFLSRLIIRVGGVGNSTYCCWLLDAQSQAKKECALDLLHFLPFVFFLPFALLTFCASYLLRFLDVASLDNQHE